MSTAVLEKIRSERDQVRAAAIAIAEGDNFNPEDENFKELQARAEQLDARAAAMSDLLTKQADADALDGRLSKLSTRSDEEEKTETRAQSWGEMFIRSEEFKGYGNRGTSARVEVRALPTGLSDLVAAGYDGPKTVREVVEPAFPTPLLDNVTTVQVSTNSIEYVGWELVAGDAAIVPEKGLKPSAEWAPTATATTLDMIAVHTQLTRQLVEDLPAVRSMIDGKLQGLVLRKEEAEAAAALLAAVVPSYAAPAGSELIEAIRSGVGVVQAAGYMPSAVLLNPADYAALDLSVFDRNGSTSIGSGFWGLTPIPSAGQAAGVATVGDFRTAIERYVRSQVALYVTDSHADTFLHNVFTLLAERRSKTVVVEPAALVEVSVAP